VKEDEKLENVISQIRDVEEVDEGVAAAAKVAGRLAMRALTSKAAKKAAKKVGKSALAGATAGAAERAGEVAYDKTRNLGKKKREDEDDEEYTEEYVDERTRYAKETGKDPQTGKPSVKGGEKPDPAFAQVSRELRKTGGMMSSRRNPIRPQGKKKVPGAKSPKGITPVDRIRGKLAKKRAPKPDIGSRFD